MIEAAIVKRLRDTSAVTSIVSERIYPATLIQDETNPKLLYQRISTQTENTNDGPTNSPMARIQIDCYAADYATVKQLAKAVRECLSGFRGTITPVISGTPTAVIVDGIFLDDEKDMPQPSKEGTEKAIQRVMQDYRVNHKL